MQMLEGPLSGLEGVFPHPSGVKNLVLVLVCMTAFILSVVASVKVLGDKLEWRLEQTPYKALELFCLVHLYDRMESASCHRDGTVNSA